MHEGSDDSDDEGDFQSVYNTMCDEENNEVINLDDLETANNAMQLEETKEIITNKSE